MHPNKAFQWNDRDEILNFAGERSFAHVFTSSAGGLFVVHVPVLVKDGRIWFHVARRNRIADQLDGQPVLISIAGREGYQSASWYVTENQVPTWHYESVEIEGSAKRLSDDELIELLDRLSDAMEHRYSPDSPWTRAKMDAGKFEAMTRAIVGFEVDPVDMLGTRKFNQHKAGDDLRATIEGQATAGRTDIVAAIEEMKRNG